MNVLAEHFHKHILPDLPGPLKMKQLLVWAAQKAAGSMAEHSKKPTGDWEEMVSEPVVQGLHTNELNVSWYQRAAGDASGAVLRANPVNVDMRECLGLYQRYYKQLDAELAKWRAHEETGPVPPSVPAAQPCDEPPRKASADLGAMGRWVQRLPMHVDRLGWLLQVYGSLEGRSKAYCEDVFRQIFEKFFAADQRQAAANPIQVLRALSAAAPQ